MSAKTAVIMNEQHTLLEEQETILNDRFPGWEYLKVPAKGWNKNEIDEVIRSLSKHGTVIFVSPLPYMVKEMSRQAGLAEAGAICPDRIYTSAPKVLIFHNDSRTKKELPNGKTVSVTAKTGWELF